MKFKVLICLLLVVVCVFPTMAQQPTGTLNSVSFNGFSFNFDSSLAMNVNISQFAGDAADLQQPGGPEVRHTQFLLYNAAVSPESFLDANGAIRVYQTADFGTFPNAQGQLQQLQTLLTDRADLTPFMAADPNNANTLPFMPQMPASQVIRARAQYVETASVRGVSYVTVYRQDVSPFVSSEFLYTFQGVSVDGSQYVSAIFRVNATVFPTEIPTDFDMETFNTAFNDYLVESVDQLNQGGVETFTPSLSTIDAVIQSISFAPTSDGGVVVAPTATATVLVNDDPTFGGLAGVTWILTSYGAPEAPTAAIPNVPVTIGFSETGVAGNSGCNGYGGAFTYNNGALTITDVVGTLMACADNNVNVQEAAYLAALSTATNYQIVGNQLQIAYNGGVLVFTNALALTPTVTVTETATIAPTATP